MSDTHFDVTQRTRVVFGPGSLDRLGELTREHGGIRALLVTDPGIVQAGHSQRAVRSLQDAGVEVVIFDGARENPSSTVVDHCVEIASDAQVNFLIGLGGGSSMDTAKGCNFVLTNGGQIEDYWGVGKATSPLLPLIAVPTTTGTGSECQSFALISHPKTHIKMACGDPKAAAKVALLDPCLTRSQPRHIKICTGIDALAHAVETAVCNRRNAFSSLYSQGAFRLCAQSFLEALDHTANQDDRLLALGQMQLGAAWAGVAIESSMLGAAHAMANPLTKRFGLTHGLAVGFMLPTVVRFNGGDPGAEAIYRELLMMTGNSPSISATRSASDQLATWLESTIAQADILPLLGSLQIPQQDLPALAAEAAEQWTAGFNPRPVSPSGFCQLYQTALERQGVLGNQSATAADEPSLDQVP